MKEQNGLLRQGQSGDLLDLGAELERARIRRELLEAASTLEREAREHMNMRGISEANFLRCTLDRVVPEEG